MDKTPSTPILLLWHLGKLSTINKFMNQSRIKQPLLKINVGMLIDALTNNLSFNIQWDGWKHSRQLPIFPGADTPARSPQGQRNTIDPRAASQTMKGHTEQTKYGLKSMTEQLREGRFVWKGEEQEAKLTWAQVRFARLNLDNFWNGVLWTNEAEAELSDLNFQCYSMSDEI